VQHHRRLELSDAFALVLQRHRLAKKFSRAALSERAGLHQTYIGLVERGLRNPSLDAIDRIAEALNVRASTLVSEAEVLRNRR
jgi:transcriptional regulator with XRE-family HTH domain